MKGFIYKDNSKHDFVNGSPVIFFCKANDINEADKLFTQEVGNHPGKTPNVGLSIVSVELLKLWQINQLTQEALTVDKTTLEGVEEEHPTGFMPPGKRKNIINIIQKIKELSL